MELYTTVLMTQDTKQQVKSFFSRFKYKQLSSHEILLTPNVKPAGAYYLEKGFVREYAISPQGVEVTIHIFSPGSFFPMTWVASNIANRYFFETLTPAEIYIAPQDEVIKFLKNHAEVLLDLTKRILNGLDKLTSRIEQLTYSQASVRIASILLFLVRHFGERKGNKARIKYPFTHRDIAALAAITRETATRELNKMEKGGLIKQTNRNFIIPNVKKIEAWL